MTPSKKEPMVHSKADAATLRHILNWIDSVPSSLPLPAMPGFDRDWVESLIDGDMDGWPELSFKDAVDMALEWVDAIPPAMRNSLPPFQRPVLEITAASPGKAPRRDESPSFDM